MKLENIGEFPFIEKIRKQFTVPDGLKGIGDDCAIIPMDSCWDMVVSTDMLVQDRHFILEDIPSRCLGWKSAAVNISDIAAMGGQGIGCFLYVALDGNLSEEWTDGFLDGFRDCCTRYGFPLLGGDTTASGNGICINVTVLGKVPGGQAKLRSSAIEGDIICVTGNLGDSACGLDVILGKASRGDDENYLVERHYLPSPRIKEGAGLLSCKGVHAMMDISDGVASDLRHIIEESHCGAVVDPALLPLSEPMKRYCTKKGIDPMEKALCGGEDYELLFTVSPEGEMQTEVPHTVIGKIIKEEKLVWEGLDRDYIGFSHF